MYWLMQCKQCKCSGHRSKSLLLLWNFYTLTHKYVFPKALVSLSWPYNLITKALPKMQSCNQLAVYYFILKCLLSLYFRNYTFKLFPDFKNLLFIITLFYSNFIFLLYHIVSLKLTYDNTCIVGTHKFAAACEVVCTCAWVWAWDFSSFSICSYYSLKSNTK